MFCTNLTNSDASTALFKEDFLNWVNKGLKIDLSADVSIEDLGKALGVWLDEERQRVEPESEEKEGGRGIAKPLVEEAVGLADHKREGETKVVDSDH